MVNRGMTRRSCNLGNMSRAENMGCDNKDSLMKKLQKVDFALVEIGLYLDAYPHCEKGLAFYHKFCEERKALMEALGESGMPITMKDNASHTSWDWTNAPWPWQTDAN